VIAVVPDNRAATHFLFQRTVDQRLAVSKRRKYKLCRALRDRIVRLIKQNGKAEFRVNSTENIRNRIDIERIYAALGKRNHLLAALFGKARDTK